MNQTTTFVNGSFVVIAGRPAMGKSALALDIAEHLAQHSDKNILIVSLEMSKEQIMFRLQKAYNNQSHKNIVVCDEPVIMTVKTIRELCESTKNLGAVIIDYLQLICSEEKSTKTQSRYEQLDDISRELKIMARNLNVPVICTSQLSKKCELRSDKRPTISDLCHTRVNEHAMDQIIFLYRDRYYNPETPVGDMAECIIAKNRYGDIGTIKLRWDPERVAFSLWEE